MAAFYAVRRMNKTTNASYTQITYQRGQVFQARFSPDGQTIVYSAEWNGQPSDVFITRGDWDVGSLAAVGWSPERVG